MTLTADADGYMTQIQPAEVKPRADNPADISLKHRPKMALVAVTPEGDHHQAAGPVRHRLGGHPAGVGRAAHRDRRCVHPQSAHPSRRDQGHTDSEGADDHNQTLSDDRANSVRTWLVQHGVGSERLVAKGYGEKKPLVPNVTPANRARNRRVQFVILEQDAAVPAAGKPATPPKP